MQPPQPGIYQPQHQGLPSSQQQRQPGPPVNYSLQNSNDMLNGHSRPPTMSNGPPMPPTNTAFRPVNPAQQQGE